MDVKLGSVPDPGHVNVTYERNVTAALLEAKNQLANGGIKDGWIEGGSWSTRPAGTNIEIYVQNDSGGKMTYPVLALALSGLYDMMAQGINWKQLPIVFQISDSDWGTMGVGYAAYIYPDTKECVYALDVSEDRVAHFPCSDVKQGKVIPSE